MIDLTTTYLGLNLKSPLVASASPLSEDIDNIRQMEDAGAAAVVLQSLFEEQITVESHDLDRNLNTGEPAATAVRMLVAHQKIYHDPARASYIELPVLKGAGVT